MKLATSVFFKQPFSVGEPVLGKVTFKSNALILHLLMESMATCYVTFELLFKSGQGLLVFPKSEMNRPQAEGKVNSCLYRGHSSNKLYDEYDAGEESSTLFSDNKN